jgi:hypothetical protein
MYVRWEPPAPHSQGKVGREESRARRRRNKVGLQAQPQPQLLAKSHGRGRGKEDGDKPQQFVLCQWSKMAWSSTPKTISSTGGC